MYKSYPFLQSLISYNLILRLAYIFSSGKFDVLVSVKILTSACDQVRKEVEVGVLGFCMYVLMYPIRRLISA